MQTSLPTCQHNSNNSQPQFRQKSTKIPPKIYQKDTKISPKRHQQVTKTTEKSRNGCEKLSPARGSIFPWQGPHGRRRAKCGSRRVGFAVCSHSHTKQPRAPHNFTKIPPNFHQKDTKLPRKIHQHFTKKTRMFYHEFAIGAALGKC